MVIISPILERDDNHGEILANTAGKNINSPELSGKLKTILAHLSCQVRQEQDQLT